MNETRLLRLAIWALLALAALFQAAFLFELHSPLPSDLALWSLSVLSIACVTIVLLVRGRLAAEAKISYAFERLFHFDDEAEYRVQGVYRVVLYRPVH
jgi:hypothetical protein